MKILGLLLVFLMCSNLPESVNSQDHFVDSESLDETKDEDSSRVSRQTQDTVRSILEWLQGRYTRKVSTRSYGQQDTAASQPVRQYLPAPVPEQQRPRPFQPSQPSPRPTPQPPSPTPTYPQQPIPSSPVPRPSYPQPPAPPSQPSGYPYPSTPAPPFPIEQPSTFQPPLPPSLQPPVNGPYPRPEQPRPSFPTPPPSQPTYPQPSYPTQPTGPSYSTGPSYGPSYSSSQPTGPNSSPYGPSYSSPQPTGPNSSPYGPSYSSPQPTGPTGYPSSTSSFPTQGPTGNDIVQPGPFPDNDLAHPPHIHEIDVQCAKDQMTINIEFNREFNGVIYSKGYHNQPECRYVSPDSGLTRYSFTVQLDSCGTQFIDQFKEGGQAYLENVLVLQNEPGIQEVWDTVRRVRCLWEGSINKALSVALSVDMLNQETVTFNGDTAIARLDIQAGRGPFAPAANGLVKIGETMTLVVSVEGDPGFDVQVRDCVARDSTSTNIVKLTDERGCVIKKKLIGAFQKTRDTGNSGASIIAYAFFQAFKFPDVMDLTLDCNVELCKTDCDVCPDPNQSYDPVARRKRDLWMASNETIGEPVRMIRTFRVISPDDLEEPSAAATVINVGSASDGVCMSMASFLMAAIFLLSLLIVSCLLSTVLWLKHHKLSTSPLIAKTIHLENFPTSRA